MRSRATAVVFVALLAAACTRTDHRAGSQPIGGGGFTPASTPSTSSAAAGSSQTPAWPATNLYAGVTENRLSPVVQGVPARVYVPNTLANTVDVIDPATFAVVDHYPVGRVPHHITPSWDMTRLFVDNTEGDSLTVIDPLTGRPSGSIPVTDPYNLYFTVDGTMAIVVAERHRRIDFRNPNTWALIKTLDVPWPGVDHLDLSADGSYFLVSTEFSGQVVKVDTARMEIAGRVNVGGLPVDVKVAPDGSVFYVANQARHGVSVIDPVAMQEIQFIPTGRGAHGLQISRDARSLFVTNRLAGSVTKIDLTTRALIGTSHIGGSPDMMQVSPDGSQLWFSNRNHAAVAVMDAESGRLLHVIKTGRGAHGLAYFPQPGRFNVGHNGVYR
jgi:YVTN family beta-propeller protein